jgi:hypothetical protein
MKLNSQQLKLAKQWIKECVWQENELYSENWIDELTDREIELGIAKHYDGEFLLL